MLPRIEGCTLYKPSGAPLSQMEIIRRGLDGLEAMRLCDFAGMQQVASSDSMVIFRATIHRLLETGRRRALDALVSGKVLLFADADHVCIRPTAETGQGHGGRRGGNGHGGRARG